MAVSLLLLYCSSATLAPFSSLHFQDMLPPQELLLLPFYLSGMIFRRYPQFLPSSSSDLCSKVTFPLRLLVHNFSNFYFQPSSQIPVSFTALVFLPLGTCIVSSLTCFRFGIPSQIPSVSIS